MAGSDILVVDDNQMNLTLVEYILNAKGYVVRSAANAEAAIDALRDRHPDLILMDLQMPGVNGIDLTRRLKADPATRDIPIIAVTAYAMKGDAERSLAAGFDDHVTKPIDRELLCSTIAHHLARVNAAK